MLKFLPLRSSRPFVALLVCLAFSGLGASQALAQSTRDRLTTLEQRMLRIERVITNNNDSQTDMLRKLQELQAENQALRNEIEKLQFETVQAADRQRQLYMDIDQRIEGLSSAGAAPGLPQAASTSGGIVTEGSLVTVASTSSPDADYQAAFDLLKQGNYGEAASAFNRFLSVHPNSELRGNAEYWLAEISYAQQDFSAALDAFQKVIATYPASRKIPDAWLKSGFCQYELQRWSEARQSLNTVVSQYPETTAARLASQRLETMRAEGR